MDIFNKAKESISMAGKGFTQKANEAVNLAVAQASAMGHNYIGSEHLLLGLIMAEGSAASAYPFPWPPGGFHPAWSGCPGMRLLLRHCLPGAHHPPALHQTLPGQFPTTFPSRSACR